MQRHVTELEESIAAEDKITAACVKVCRGDIAAGRSMAQRVMLRTETSVRELKKVLKSRALADAGVFAVLGFDRVRGL